MTETAGGRERDGGATTLAIAVRSTDMDADRNVNNSRFFEFFEQSRLEHLLKLGVVRWPPAREGGPPQFALAQTAAQFRAPAVHRDTLLVTTRTRAVGTRSFTLAYEVRRAGDGVLICEGSSVQVWLSPDGGSAPLPAEVHAALEESITVDREEEGADVPPRG